MNKIKCLIVDDEGIARRIISGYLNDLSGFEIVGTSKNAMEAMKVLEVQQVDLLFLDIEMPKLNGMDFLRTLTHKPKVIITTAHREYALEGYELEILDYLLKPISFERFIIAVNRFKKSNVEETGINPDKVKEQVLYVKSERKTLKLDMLDISHIEGMNNYIIIHLGDRRHIVYRSLIDIMNELSEDFVRIHKSFVVNSLKIKSFSKEEVAINDRILPIGKTYKNVVDKF